MPSRAEAALLKNQGMRSSRGILARDVNLEEDNGRELELSAILSLSAYRTTREVSMKCGDPGSFFVRMRLEERSHPQDPLHAVRDGQPSKSLEVGPFVLIKPPCPFAKENISHWMSEGHSQCRPT